MSHNLFAEIPASLPREITERLLWTGDLRIERIVSRGHASPDDFWYDQAEHEWVLVLQGAARLQVCEAPGKVQTVELRAGDYLQLPAHQRHRVEWTTPATDTIWLAIFYADTEPVGLPKAQDVVAANSQFSLSQLFVLVTLAAVGLGSFVWASWFGPFFTLVCGIAYAAHRNWLTPGQVVMLTLLVLGLGITLVRLFFG